MPTYHHSLWGPDAHWGKEPMEESQQQHFPSEMEFHFWALLKGWQPMWSLLVWTVWQHDTKPSGGHGRQKYLLGLWSAFQLPHATASWLTLPVESGTKHSISLSQILFGGCTFTSQQNLVPPPPLIASTNTRSEHYDTPGVLALSWVNKLHTHHLSYTKDSDFANKVQSHSC